jgi:acetoin utilization protein AcuC
LTVNVGLPRHTGDAAYLASFRQVVPAALRAYRPDVLLVNFGVDGHHRDPLVRLGLTTAAYGAIAAELHQLAHELCAGRLLLTGSGGYHPIHAARCWAMMLAVLAGDIQPAGRIPERCAVLVDQPLPADPAVAARALAAATHVAQTVLPLRLAL